MVKRWQHNRSLACGDRETDNCLNILLTSDIYRGQKQLSALLESYSCAI